MPSSQSARRRQSEIFYKRQGEKHPSGPRVDYTHLCRVKPTAPFFDGALRVRFSTRRHRRQRSGSAFDWDASFVGREQADGVRHANVPGVVLLGGRHSSFLTPCAAVSLRALVGAMASS
jgi:hypothetical protein